MDRRYRLVAVKCLLQIIDFILEQREKFFVLLSFMSKIVQSWDSSEKIIDHLTGTM